ncbi:uncharacterized protein LOC132932590 [Metopolophium dirhodum]|uniref:uncharacterized protein LOC132932590 n=1 Tax=Metopolophium dirhodum TaxID=44670 RepID=UPI0029903C06|nr:uncharacterized protein LOC132932590 [Metopolophium dirhodum]
MNNIYSVDIQFNLFISTLESWWTNPFNDMGYSQPQLPTTIGNFQIIVDDESIVEFFVPTIIDFNKRLILACLYIYYKYSVNKKHTLYNIYNHITVVMCIIRHRFINKSGTKKVLLQLTEENYLTKNIKNEYQGKLSIIEEITKHKDEGIINEILIITEEVYMKTAIFYNLPTTVFSKYIQKCTGPVNRELIFEKFQKKINFIKKFLIYITDIHQTTFDTIHRTYNNETEIYKKELQNLLATLPKITKDSTLTAQEIKELIAKHHSQNPTNYFQKSNLSPSTLKSFSSSKLQFYRV